jgi:anti-sigma factor RsiW
MSVYHPHTIPLEWLAAYHDGELDSARRGAVEAHLPGCASCRQELAALLSLSDVLAVDRLPDDAVTSHAALWSKLEPQLPDRSPATLSPVGWLPGISLLLVGGVVQFVAVAVAIVTLVDGRASWAAEPLAWLGRVAAGALVGWLAWLLPEQWAGLGLAGALVIVTGWLAALYLAWLCYAWRYRWQPAMRLVS